MRGYDKGTDVTAELVRLRHAFARVATAIHASYDGDTAWQQARQLGELINTMRGDAAAVRGQVVLDIMATRGLSINGAAKQLGLSTPRAAALVKAARERGAIMTDTSDMPAQPAVALAIITNDRGQVLAEQRKDGIPPWTFPGGEVNPGETPRAAAKRRVLAETGLTVQVGTKIGQRVHPRTGRQMHYLAAIVTGGELACLDTEDLSDVAWLSMEQTRERMPDMYQPVRDHLDQQAGQQ
jgi:8-oxo-dGTP diphosphatase